MRNKGFITIKRGGTLNEASHRQLMKWAIACAKHILPLVKEGKDGRLIEALKIAKEWEREKIKTGVAMTASRQVHKLARTFDDPVAKAVARSVGHAVATAHMADHCIGAPLYALKALQLAEKSLQKEKHWQYKHLQKLPAGLVELVENTMKVKAQSFGLE